MPFQPSKWHFNIDRYLNPWIPKAPWRHLPSPLAHFLGHRSKPQRYLGNIAMVFWAFIGVFSGLIIIELVSREIPSFHSHGAPIIIGSFGAAAVLEFYAIESPLAQPRNAILGQLFASVIGVTISKLFALGPDLKDLTWLAGSLSCACATAVMALTGTVHPPAGATALLAVVDDDVAQLGWFLIPVILLGCVLMQTVALLLNNIQRRFPSYWWTPEDVGQRWEGKEKGKEKSGGRSDTDNESAAKMASVDFRHLENGEIDDVRHIIVKRGHVSVPDDIYLTPEERTMLQELSERL